VIRVFPQIDNAKLMELFRKGVEGQWSASQLQWDQPLLLDRDEREAFAHVLTPVYLGEQAAMLGASSVIPQFFSAHQTEAQLYLATFMLDEARHFEALTRFYHKIEQRPLEVRELKVMFRYQARLFQARDKVEWLWGILVSDILARHFYSILVKAHPESLFAHIGRRIVTDEARHLAFAELYLKAALQRTPELKPVFLKMREELVQLIREIYAGVREKAMLIGLEETELFDRVTQDIEKKVRRLQMKEPEQDLSE
jgi:ribonucleotide reductase beta subunit family protein with ferritin-like domain